MDLQLAGRRCLVTGASAGIGASVVAVLAREGAKVVATARRADLLQSIADAVESAGHVRPETIVADMTDREDVTRLAHAASEGAGPIEILVNCAGYSMPVVPDASDEVWDDAFDLNFTAVRRLSTALLPAMQQTGFGRIINMTSVMEPMILNATSSAKAAVHIWAKGLSRVVARDGVTINCVAPGRIDSEQVDNRLYTTNDARKAFIEKHIPIGYFGKPQDVGNLVAFLASPLASYITGTIIAVDGGMKYGL